MVTVQVRDFNASVQWYRDVLGLVVRWSEPEEFCMLVPHGSAGPALALATDHPDRIPAAPGTGWTPTLTVDDLDSPLMSTAPWSDFRRRGGGRGRGLPAL